jgi:hypothetical protein
MLGMDTTLRSVIVSFFWQQDSDEGHAPATTVSNWSL